MLSFASPKRAAALRFLLLPCLSRGLALRPPAAAATLGALSKKRHTLLTFGFVGTDFHGLQQQSAEGDPERPAVSDVIRRALLNQGYILESNFSPLARSKWSLASRTDKGVHAACAAASVMIETYDCDVVLGDDGDTRAEDYHAAAASMGTEGRPVEKDWSLAPEALERINADLPQTVRVFAGGYVRRGFDAREEASSRTYEYLLPLSAVGASASELDAVLRRFEGTHRFHNFASGLRQRTDEEQTFTCEATGATWPLAMSSNAQISASYRSVITCRVRRELVIEGVPYLVLRIAGLAFVLHQIRHMVGGALAVTNGLVPADVLQIALDSPLRVDIAPLVPGMGLLLDEIRWFNVRTGLDEATVPEAAREAMEAFKESTIYPHIHRLYADGAYGRFLDDLRNGNFTEQYDSHAIETLRQVGSAHRQAMAVKAARRREARAQRPTAEHEASSEARDAAAAPPPGLDEAAVRQRGDSGGRGRGGGGGSGGGSGGGGPKKPRAPKEGELPSGVLVELCVAAQTLPGPEMFRVHQLLKAKVATGELEPEQPTQYYLDALDWRTMR